VRYFINLSFRGAPYHGWQVQPGDISVQQVVEQALTTLLRCPTPIVGAGRTDAGVNARCMIAHFDSAKTLTEQELFGLQKSLAALCRPDITINSIFPVHETAHARFDATNRTYRYFIHTADNPFVYPLSWRAPANLDFEAMNQAGKMMLGRRDFTSFSKLHTDVKTNICDLRKAEWVKFDDNRYYFEISADRFLRNMVRAVVGTLVEVGRHKITPNDVLSILDKKNRCAAGTSMPAHPLFLWDVNYEYYNPITTDK
jgi:tRNA pseudouridine38-40 synthase